MTHLWLSCERQVLRVVSSWPPFSSCRLSHLPRFCLTTTQSYFVSNSPTSLALDALQVRNHRRYHRTCSPSNPLTTPGHDHRLSCRHAFAQREYSSLYEMYDCHNRIAIKVGGGQHPGLALYDTETSDSNQIENNKLKVLQTESWNHHNSVPVCPSHCFV